MFQSSSASRLAETSSHNFTYSRVDPTSSLYILIEQFFFEFNRVLKDCSSTSIMLAKDDNLLTNYGATKDNGKKIYRVSFNFISFIFHFDKKYAIKNLKSSNPFHIVGNPNRKSRWKGLWSHCLWHRPYRNWAWFKRYGVSTFGYWRDGGSAWRPVGFNWSGRRFGEMVRYWF